MIFAYISIVIVLAIGSRESFYAPQSEFELGFSEEEPPPCREETPDEAFASSNQQKGKAATFSLSGRYLCQRGIMEKGDRPAFYEFVIANAPRRIEADISKIKESLKFDQSSWTLRVLVDDPQLEPLISSLLAESMHSHFSKSTVYLDPITSAPPPLVLQARLREVVNSELFLELLVKKKSQSHSIEEVLWQRGS